MRKLFEILPLGFLITAGILFTLVGGCIHMVNEEQRGEDAVQEYRAAQQKKMDANTKVINRIMITPIYSLQLTNELSGQSSGSMDGSFILGCGGISGNSSGSMGETSYYYFYKDDGRGGIILSKVNAEVTSLKKTTGAPHLETVISVVQVFNKDYPQGNSPKVLSQTLYVPVNYKLLGEFKK